MSHLIFSSILLLILTTANVTLAGPTGSWEGQLLSPLRPIVVQVNFSTKTARLDATGSRELTVEELESQGANVKFAILLSDQKLSFMGTWIGGQMSGTVQGFKQPQNFTLTRLPDFRPVQNRIDGWYQDIDAMLHRFLLYDRSYTDAQRKQAIDILTTLQSSLDNKTEEQIIVELSRAVAQTDNAHTRLYLLRNRTELRRYPVRLWWFSDGLYVVKTTSSYRDLLACRVSRIGQHEPPTVRRQVAELFAGNESWTDYKSVYYMTSPEILRGLGLISNMEKAEWTFQCQSKSITRELTPLPLARKEKPTEAWWDLTPEWKADNDSWVHSLDSREAPLYLRRPEQHYWFEEIPAKQALYFQYNRAQNKPDAETLKTFGERVVHAFSAPGVQNLIVDLRFNTGGDLGIARELMESLKKKADEKKARVSVLISRSTFSAGISHAAQWKDSAQATFIGEPCGDVLDFFSEGGNVVLPYSKLLAHYANGFHTYSKKEYPEYEPYYLDMNVDDLKPDLQISPSARDYFSGRDALLDAALSRNSTR